MVLPCDLGQFDRVAKQAVQGADDGTRALQGTESGIHFRPAGAQELRQLAL
jgi:lysophospholipase L1-like esterase